MTTESESIRNALDEDERQEFLNKATGQWYVVENGEIKQINDQEAA